MTTDGKRRKYITASVYYYYLMDKQFYTYLHCKPSGDPFYVGKGSGKRSHDFERGRNRYYRNIVAKYGAENIHVFIFKCGSEQQALDDEIQQIAQLQCNGYKLCNLTIGGDGPSGYKHTENSRAKMSAIHKGKQVSKATRVKISIANKGRVLSANTKLKISAGNKGKVIAFETRVKLSKAAISRKLGESKYENKYIEDEKRRLFMNNN